DKDHFGGEMIRAFMMACMVTLTTADLVAETAARAETVIVPDQPIRLATGTPVDIEIVDALNSKTSKIDDLFRIKLVNAIMVDGRPAVPAGTEGVGQVVHAAKARLGGRAGELIVTARYLEMNGVRIPLRRFRVGSTGQQRGDEAFAVSLVIPFGFVLVG